MLMTLDPDVVIRSAFEIPALPQSAVRLAGIVANDTIELGEVVQVIECDPALTLKLLRIANSVYSSPSRAIGTVKDSVVRLGTGAVLGLAIGACVQPNLVRVIPGYNMPAGEFWRHSLAAAIATEMLKSISRQRLTPLAFTTALLHDIGKIVLGKFLDPETLELLERASLEGHQEFSRSESEILSINHAEIGGIVAQHWGLPEAVVKGITFHHDPTNCDDPIGFTTHFANYVAHRVTPSSNRSPDNPDFCLNDDAAPDLDYFGLTANQLPKIFQMVGDRLTAIAADYSR